MLERIDTSDSNAPSHQGKVGNPPPPQSKDDGEMRAARGLHGKMLKL